MVIVFKSYLSTTIFHEEFNGHKIQSPMQISDGVPIPLPEKLNTYKPTQLCLKSLFFVWEKISFALDFYNNFYYYIWLINLY